MNELHNLIEHCNALYEQEKFEDLIVSVENGLASFPNSHELYLIKGKANNKLGNTENAISDYTNAIQIKPDFCKAYYLRGNQFKNLEEYKKAIDDYERAIQLDPDYSNAYYQIGNINLYVFNNEDIAETYFGKSIEINNDTDSLFCRGQIYLYQGKETEALNDFNKIIELDSEFLGAYYFRGQIFNNQQEYKKAIEDLNKAFDYYSDNSEYFYILADCHSSLEDYETSLNYINRAIELNPDDIKYLYFKATYLENLDRFEESLETINILLSLDKQYEAGYFMRCRINYILRNYTETIKDANIFFSITDNNRKSILPLRGLSYFYLGKYLEAIKDLTEVLSYGMDEEFLLRRADSYSKLRMYNDAIADMDLYLRNNKHLAELDSDEGEKYKAYKEHRDATIKYVDEYYKMQEVLNNSNDFLSQNPEISSDYIIKAESYYHSGDFQKAIECITKALEEAPDNMEIYLKRGEMFKKMGSIEDSLNDFTHIVKNNNDFLADALFQRASVYEDLNNHDKAIEDYTDCLRINPDEYKALVNRGNIYRKKGEYEKAINDYNKACNINPSVQEIYFARGVTYTLLNEFDKAISDISSGLIINPEHSMANTHRGIAYFMREEYDLALKDFNKAIELDQNNAFAYSQRGKCKLKMSMDKEGYSDLQKAEKLGYNSSSSLKNL